MPLAERPSQAVEDPEPVLALPSLENTEIPRRQNTDAVRGCLDHAHNRTVAKKVLPSSPAASDACLPLPHASSSNASPLALAE